MPKGSRILGSLSSPLGWALRVRPPAVTTARVTRMCFRVVFMGVSFNKEHTWIVPTSKPSEFSETNPPG
jgi:hypothetical protein